MYAVSCPRCGDACAPGSLFCSRCGARLAAVAGASLTWRQCPSCGQAVEAAAAACPYCGRRLPAQVPALVLFQEEFDPRPAQLEAAINEYLAAGYRVVWRSETAAQLLRPKEFSPACAFVSFLFFGVGLLVYIAYYLLKSEETVYLDIRSFAPATIPRNPVTPQWAGSAQAAVPTAIGARTAIPQVAGVRQTSPVARPTPRQGRRRSPRNVLMAAVYCAAMLTGLVLAVRTLSSERDATGQALDRGSALATPASTGFAGFATDLAATASAIPTLPPPPATETPQPHSLTTGTYTVVSGDTLADIAQRLGVSVDALAAANHIPDPNSLTVGQVLVVPPQ